MYMPRNGGLGLTMSEERRYGINWVDLIIKIILVVLFVLLICWLFPMPKLDTFYDQVFNNNIQTMKEAARNYYTTDRLPSSIGETNTMSLKQLIDNKLILEFKDKDGNTCDTTNSYVQVTKTLDSEYALKVQLTCGDESDYIIDTIGCNGTCLLSEVNNTSNVSSVSDTANDSDNSYSYSSTGNGKNTTYYYPVVGATNSNSSNTTTTTTTTTKTYKYYSSIKNSSSSSSSSSSTNLGSKKLYYQHAKIVKKYGDWIEGYKTGSNIDNKTESVKYYYYTNNSSNTSAYRTSSYVDSNDLRSGYKYSYELQLIDIPSSTTNVSITTDRFFNTNDYSLYLKNSNTNLYMTGNDMLANSSNNSATIMRNASLKSGNFTYSLSNPYKSNGVWRVKVTITLKNRIGVNPYYDAKLGKSLYYVPVYFKVSYNSKSNKILDTEANAYKYSGYTRSYAYTKTVHYYRYITQTTDYNQIKWSTSRNLSGYKFTGVTKYM